ncbi:MAG: glycosyltransferase family 2 protein [Oligoflexia bacterium]|nr:glycosyltransferase family 2 protein [Oligoflexia bacterium]
MKDNNFSPIALFVYNRPYHTKKTIEALQKNLLANVSDLFIFSDSYKNETEIKNVSDVRNYLKLVTEFKNVTIIERQKNLGLANSIISGVTEIANKYGKVIVLEDDLVTSKYFLTYMNEALDLYKDVDKVASIHGYTYPVKYPLPETFFLRGADCWGWATWKRSWDLFESDGKKLLKLLEKKHLIKEFNLDDSYNYSKMLERQILGLNDSWAVRWHASCFLSNKLTLYPGYSLVNNIGHDSSGTHSRKSDSFETTLYENQIKLQKIPIEENIIAKKAIIKYFNSKKAGIISRVIQKLIR